MCDKIKFQTPIPVFISYSAYLWTTTKEGKQYFFSIRIAPEHTEENGLKGKKTPEKMNFTPRQIL